MTERAGSRDAEKRRSAGDLAAVPIHPILFFVYPVVALLASNSQEIYASQSLRSLAVTLAGCLVLWALLALILRDVRRAAVLTSLAGLLFFSYGHVYDALVARWAPGFPLARHRFLLPVYAATFLAAAYGVVRRSTLAEGMTRVLNLSGLAVLALPLLSLGTLQVRARINVEERATRIPRIVLHPRSDERPPDIYYIILDGYARSDYLRDVIGLDNSDFIGYLADEGFYVAAESRSNHNWTSLSLASSLNLTLAQYLGANMLPGYYPTPFVDYIRDSALSRSLKEIGYVTVGLQSGYLPTEWVDADHYLGPATDRLPAQEEGLPLNAFESMLLDTTALQPLLNTRILSLPGTDTPVDTESYPSATLRAIILSEFDHLAQQSPAQGPRLVFAHIVSPDRPFLFTATGEARDTDEPLTLIDPDEPSEDSIVLYRDQAIFITARTRETIQSILDRSDTPPVIILQADHGPGLGLAQDARTAILNAILIREDCRSLLYPSITPVNTFRVVLDCYFDADLPLVEDEVYWSKWPRKAAYEFQLLDSEAGQP